MGRVPGFSGRNGGGVRYYLAANGVEAEVSVSATGPDASTVSTVLHGSEGRSERHFVLCAGAAHEVCQDGSYRRHTLLPGAHVAGRWTFFHSGRERVVVPVGGIGGRVETLQSEGNVSAPMNGQVVKVVKKVGDPIESGDIVLILEAMKMENEVTAPISGVLKELKVEPGHTVAPGQLLFCVEAVV